MGGRIVALVGPMFGGKTTGLIVETERERCAGRHVLLIKYAADTRYGDDSAIVTHRGIRIRSEDATDDMGPLTVVAADILGEVEVPASVGTIGIDEGQFFGDLEGCVERWAGQGRNVVVAALNGDYARKPFPRVSALLALATSIRHFPAVCRCGQDAPYTLKIVADQPVGGELIGGADKFRAMCPACYALNSGRCAPRATS